MRRKVWRHTKTESRISYIKKPFARQSMIAMGLSVVSLILLVFGFCQAIKTDGEIPLNYLVMCLFSAIFAVTAFYYAIRSFFEKEKDYLFSKISLVLGVLEVMFWAVVLVMGFLV